MNSTLPKNHEIWGAQCCFGHKSATEFWVRWTDDRGIYWFLHPLENVWIEDGNQIHMPDFPTAAAAHKAVARAPDPPSWKLGGAIME